jgi:hypothetical protein
MTSPRPETTDRSEQTEDKEKPQGAQLSATQVAAGALAAVSSAVVASFFGLAGTLIGAALASVISTVSAALYSSSLHKTKEKLGRARGQLTGRQSTVEETKVAPAAPATPATRVLPAHLDPRRAPDRRSRPRWAKVAVYAAAVFVVAMGIVTGIELIGQKPVSALVSGTETSRTTTLSAITNASSSSSSEEQDEDPSTPSSPTTTAPATETSAPATSTDDESTSEDEEGSDNEESSSATPTRTSEAEPTSSSEPSDSSDGSSGDSSQDYSGDDTSPAPEAGSTP